MGIEPVCDGYMSNTFPFEGRVGGAALGISASATRAAGARFFFQRPVGHEAA
jgi:hypothetical protein